MDNLSSFYQSTLARMRFIYTILFTAGLFALASCKTPKAATGITVPNGSESKTADQVATGNYILMLVIKASRKAGDSTIVFEVVKTTKKEGKLKPGQNDNSGTEYAVSFADAQQKPVQTYYVKHPLDTWVESADESGKLETKPMKMDEASFPVRTNYTADMKYIIIKKNKGTDTNKTVIPLNVQ